MKLNWKIWLLIVCISASLLAIFPLNFASGVQIVSVEVDSIAYNQGIRQGMLITSVDQQLVNNFEDYKFAISKFLISEKEKLTINTNEGEFILFTNQSPEITVANIPKTKIKLKKIMIG